MAINLDHVTEQITVTDTATNASLTVQPKGTGAFNIAAGSSGINLSNGGTITAITSTDPGSAYTSVPTVNITAPTTAGGVQAVITTNVAINAGTIGSGGTGYTVGNVLTLVGGTTTGGASTWTVAAVSGGVVTSVTSTSPARYTAFPSLPASVTGGSGSGFTFSALSGFVNQFVISNAGSGYVEQPAISFTGGGGSAAAAYATVGSGVAALRGLTGNFAIYTPAGEHTRFVDNGQGNTYWTVYSNPTLISPNGSAANIPASFSSKGASGINLYTNTGNQLQAVIAHTASAVNYVQLSGAATGGTPYSLAAGSDTNIGYVIATKGTGSLGVWTNNGAQQQLAVAHTASAVNYVQATGSITGSPVAISAQGSDSNIRMNLFSKGTESIDILTSGGAVRQARFTNTASTVNWVQMTGSATGFGAVVRAAGSDTNIPLVVQPQGTGALQAQQTDSTATGGNARGAYANDWQRTRGNASHVANGYGCVIGGGESNTANGYETTVGGGAANTASNNYSFVGGGGGNIAGQHHSAVVGGYENTAGGILNFIGTGYKNSGTSGSPATSQSATMNGTTAVTLSASNASIKVGQLILGTSITSFPYTYVAAVSGTSLTLSQAASGSSTSTLSFYTPHGVVVGGGNNTATGSYSFIGGGGDAGTASNRNVASGDWSFVGGGRRNTASGAGSTVAGGGTSGTDTYPNTASAVLSTISGGWNNTASGTFAVIAGGQSHTASGYGSAILGGTDNVASGFYNAVLGGQLGWTRGITGNLVFPACAQPIAFSAGASQSALIILARQTTDATATRLTSDATATGGTANQVIMPNNSAYFFTGEVVAGVTGGGNTKGWTIEGVIKRGANAASTALVGTPTVTSTYADAGASTWTIAVTADTTNGGLAVTFTGQASTTIRTVAQIRTTEMTF